MIFSGICSFLRKEFDFEVAGAWKRYFCWEKFHKNRTSEENVYFFGSWRVIPLLKKMFPYPCCIASHPQNLSITFKMGNAWGGESVAVVLANACADAFECVSARRSCVRFDRKCMRETNRCSAIILRNHMAVSRLFRLRILVSTLPHKPIVRAGLGPPWLALQQISCNRFHKSD